MEAFSNVAQVPITLLNSNGDKLWMSLGEKCFCNTFDHCSNCQANCLRTLNNAMSTALTLNEPYLFVCSAGLLQLAVPFLSEGKITGCFYVGPFFMGHSKERAIKLLLQKFQVNHDHIVDVLAFIDKIQIKSSTDVSYLIHVLTNCMMFQNMLESNYGTVLIEPADKLEEKPKDMVNSLMDAIQSGSREDSEECARMLYERTYLHEGGSFIGTKNLLIEHLNSINRFLVADEITSPKSISLMAEIQNSYNFRGLYQNTINLIKYLTETYSTYRGDSKLIRDATDYINQNYKDDITLTKVAKEIHVNPSYLSTLFKNKMGKNFSIYLREVRLKESAALLMKTHYSVTELAMEVGFSNQSYFIKSFRDYYGMTPGQYRKKML